MKKLKWRKGNNYKKISWWYDNKNKNIIICEKNKFHVEKYNSLIIDKFSSELNTKIKYVV